jgi:multidrug efflux system outer membrane protein
VTRFRGVPSAQRWMLFTGCLLALSGCVQGPDYVAPQVEVPGAYRFAPQPVAGPNVEIGWWRGFGDPHLDGLVNEALAKNRNLAIAAARVDEFSAILAGTKSQALPHIGYGLSGSRSRASEEKLPAFIDPLSSNFNSLLSASWEIDLWGRIRRETEAARANLFATEEARRGVTLTVISSAISSYISLLDLDEQLRVTDSTIAGRKKSVDLFETRLAGGWISEFEMSQVRGEYQGALAQRPPILKAIAIQENALSVLLGRNPGPISRSEDFNSLRAPVVPANLPSELLLRRPDILEAEQQLIASNALIGVARAEFFPRITLTSLLGFASGSLGNLFSGNARTWSFTGDVAGPIYTGGGLTAAVDQAKARRDQSLASYELTVQSAFRDVEDSLADLKSSAELKDTLTLRVATLRRGVELANERYENGYSDYLEVLDTERSLFSAELQLASARGDYGRALTNVYRALGGDWTTAPPGGARSSTASGSSS